MAPHVIDLISSSPPLPASLGPPARESAAPAACSSPRPHSPQLFVSSEFDFDFDITDNESARQDTRNAKRPRISKSPPRSPSRLPSNPSRAAPPPFLSTTNNRPSRLEFDPIEFTSSIDPDTPIVQHNASNAGSRFTQPQPAQTNKAPPEISLNSDPFASSPPPATRVAPEERAKKRETTTTIADEFSDPFASSPLPPALPPPREPHKPKEQSESLHPKLNIDEFSDPFTSSQDFNLLLPINVSTPRRAASVEVVDYARRQKHWDPISSSAPEKTPRVSSPKKKTTAGPAVINIDSDSSGTSEDEFPDIADFNASHPRPRPRSPIRRSPTSTIAARTAEQRARDKEAQVAAKAVEKERKRQEKEQLKEAKALEKERAAALAEVNKVRTDKKVSTPEMILIMPSSVNEGLKVQLETLLDGLSVEYTTRESPIGNAFKWARKVRSRFDDEMGRWEPIPLQIKAEKHALILLTADEFVDMAVNDSVDSNVSRTKRHFPGHELIYLLEGINLWMRKNRNIRNRRFTSGVRAQEQPDSEATATAASTTAAPRRRRNNAAVEEYISEDIVEDAILRLQVEHDVLIHHTAVPLETAQWIVAFTQHISTIPYKKMRDKMTSAAGFCMESGQVRTGDDARYTYVRLLQEIARVTAPIAYGIVSEFGTVSELVRGLEQGGPLRLENVRKSANKDGAVSDRAVGQAVSRRIHKVFTGRDEMSTDV
ncbi:ERCC4 domain-containing protein [Trichoderma breve]|uniref:ERCC4 domain-containing protein n=1 Tax=Trichoderma breve TaxID=2034170 RepID=A0A9W9E4J4_9HYPO|nr:ERCC4 domain-containing protein [Trichoderma breve]KAJ4857914.1 ERCC4 domain-containing protein [Trichoderma breve]